MTEPRIATTEDLLARIDAELDDPDTPQAEREAFGAGYICGISIAMSVIHELGEAIPARTKIALMTRFGTELMRRDDLLTDTPGAPRV